jgi:2,3-bisphosphoglycerate-dependent phosphoglycerate mutase
MPDVILLRHGQSQWNLENKFTGWVDVPLSERGIEEARQAGRKLAGRRVDRLFTSVLHRAIETARLALETAGLADVPTVRDPALNERMYGDLQGMNKDQAREQFGEEQVHVWRRSFDVPPPGGESLQDTAARVVPYWDGTILPEIRAGRNVLIAAHGNSLRALAMHIEGLTTDEVLALEIPTGVPILYEFSAAGTMRRKETL